MQTAIEVLISNSLLALVLAVAATLFTRVWKNPHLSHALWLLVLVKLVTPPLVQVPIPLLAGADESLSARVMPSGESNARSVSVVDPISNLDVDSPSALIDTSEHSHSNSVSEQSIGRSASGTNSANLSWWMGAGWCMGTILLACVMCWRHQQLRKLLHNMQPADATINNVATRISEKMGLTQCPSICVTGAHVCPLVMIGWRHQTIVLPEKLLAQLNSEQLRSVIAHELAHLRRRDHWVRVFELFVLALHWWNPLAWLASRQLRRAEEECCDAWVVWTLPEGRRSYGQALMRTVEFLTEQKPHVVGASLTFGRSLFQRRIEMIMKSDVPHRMSWKLIGGLLVISAIILPVAGRSQEPDATVATQLTSDQTTDDESENAQGTTTSADFAINGVCIDWSREPLADVTVRLFTATDRTAPAELVAKTTTNEEGRFFFEELAHPVHRMQKGEYHIYGIVATHRKRASQIRQVFSADVQTVEMILNKPGTLSGHVTNEDGEPVPNATVYFQGVNGQPVPKAFSTVTDAEGFYELKDMIAFPSSGNDADNQEHAVLQFSNLVFRVEHPEFGSQTARASQVPATVDVVLKAPAIVDGVVTDIVTGKPASGVRVSAQGTHQGIHHGWRTVRTNTEGRYRMLLMPDIYNIWASMPERTVVAHDSFDAVAGENPDANLELIEGGFITGRILDADGNALGHTEGRTIRIGLHGPSRPNSGGAVESFVVEEDGTYKMRVPPGDNYPYIMSGGVWASRDPTNARKSGPVVIEENETETLDITVHGMKQDIDVLLRDNVPAPPQREIKHDTTSNEPAADNGSDFLRRIHDSAAPILADMAEHHGYGLKPGQAVRRVAPPFSDIRMTYYRTGHPSQANLIPRGPAAMTFRWEDEQLRSRGMNFGDNDDGYRMTGVLNALLGIKRQEIEGPADLLDENVPGDWIVRPDAAKEDILKQLATILRDELDLDVQLEFRTVEREVYVATGRYKLTPLSGQKGEGELQLTDEKILTDRVHIFGKTFDSNSGAGGGTGEFDKFLRWLGRWIDTPIVNEVTEQPSRQISWRLHGRSPSTDQSRREDHEPEVVLENITKQTKLLFQRETRPIEILFVE